MSMRQVVDGPGGRRYIVTADRVLTLGRPLAHLLTGTRFLPEAPDPDDAWEVRVEYGGRHQVFPAGSSEIAERLMVFLGEEIELGALEL